MNEGIGGGPPEGRREGGARDEGGHAYAALEVAEKGSRGKQREAEEGEEGIEVKSCVSTTGLEYSVLFWNLFWNHEW